MIFNMQIKFNNSFLNLHKFTSVFLNHYRYFTLRTMHKNSALLKIFKFIGFGIGFIFSSCTSREQKETKTEEQLPNIILIMADDLGYGDVAYNGNPKVKTPVLDDMAAKGVLFNRFYAAAPVSSPTRVSCLTGRHPYRVDMPWVNFNSLPEEEHTIAELLKSAGYATAHFGKWHVGLLSKTMKSEYLTSPGDTYRYSPPWNNGFDICYSSYGNLPAYNPYYLTCEEYGKPGYKMIMDKPVEPGQLTDGFIWESRIWTGPGKFEDEWLEGAFDKLIMDKAIEFIRCKKEEKKPFLSLIWFTTPHTPVVAAKEHRAIYPDLSIEEQHWFGSITAMDEQIGRLRKELKDLEIADNTVLWFCSDNGPSWIHDLNSSGGLHGKKGSLWEGGIRVPAILEYPDKFKEHKIINIPVSTSDFLPTLLAWAGVEVPDNYPLDGIDITEIIDGRSAKRSKPIGFQSPVLQTNSQDVNAWKEYSGKAMVWLDNDFKLISVNEGKDWSLYDLSGDKTESNNIAFENQDIVERMKKELYSWVNSCSESASGADYKNKP